MVGKNNKEILGRKFACTETIIDAFEKMVDEDDTPYAVAVAKLNHTFPQDAVAKALEKHAEKVAQLAASQTQKEAATSKVK